MSHTQVQWGRGSSSQVAGYTGPQGEVVVNTDDYSLAIQDGAAAGGRTRLTPGILPPQGRLTLTSNTPVMTSDLTAAATVYYTPYVGQWCPIYNGTVWQQWAFSQASLALDGTTTDTGYQASGSLFDIFAFNNGGSFAIGTGPAWSSATARNAAIAPLNGIWVNSAAITLRFGNASGNTASVPANQATYLGTMYATANGQTAMQSAPAAASGGSNNVLGLYNAYHRVRTLSRSQDSTGSWSYTSGAWRPSDNSTGNRVTWIDGLQQSWAAATLAQSLGTSSATMQIGIAIDAVSGTPAQVGGVNAPEATITIGAQSLALGLHYAQAMEAGGAGCTFLGSPNMTLTLAVDL